MARPRSEIVCLDRTRWYHCVSRCVRRAFLCGQDEYTGRDYNHRKPWIVQRLALLTETFAIDVGAYAIMSNHYHVVLYVDPERAAQWSKDEVIRRWHRVFGGEELARRYLQGESLTPAELALVDGYAAKWRKRLSNISWFMRRLNEHIAVRANREDECTGRFWEGRFKSQALLDEPAVLSAMAYVDLNPVRAGLCTDLAGSDYTSIQTRLAAIASGGAPGEESGEAPRLMPFGADGNLPGMVKDYIALVEWTGSIVRPDKRGHLAGTGAESEPVPDAEPGSGSDSGDKEPPALLTHLKLSDTQWRQLILDVRKESVCLLHGLERLALLERRRARRGRAA